MADLPVSSAFDPGAKLQMVKVTNKNDFAIRDRFDGVPYDFAPNAPLSIPPAAAAHFFGWPGEADVMKAYTCKRFGWNRPEHIGADRRQPTSDHLADLYWSNIVIEEVNFCVVPEADPSLPELGPEDEPMTEGLAPPPPVTQDTLTRVGKQRRRGRPRKVTT